MAAITPMGTEEDLLAEMRHHGTSVGITSFCVPAASMDALAPIVGALAT